MQATWKTTVLKPLSTLIIAFLLLLARTPASGADDPADMPIQHGLDFLAAQQNSDGSFGPTQKPAATGLALMAFLAGGHAPNATNVGKYGANVAMAIEYLLKQAQLDGSFGRTDRPMYGQAMATLALAQAYGVDDSEPRRKRIAAALAGSVKLIIAAQEVHKPESYGGGWRFEANSADSDMTMTGWNMLALRACQDVGINAARGPSPRAMKFIVKCYNAAGKGFANQPGGPVETGASGIAALCLHLQEGGAPTGFEAAEKTLLQMPPNDNLQDSYFGVFCQTLAALKVDDATWKTVSTTTFEKLVKAQQPDGGWPDAGAEFPGGGRVYTTSISLLTLSIPLQLLPGYQR